MTEVKWNPNNTEGHWSVSYDFLDTEIRKDNKIVATDIVDLYDVDVTGVVDGQILVFDGNRQLWVPGEAGANCSIIEEDTNIYIGGFGADFHSIEDCFNWLRNNCIIISENAILKIIINSTITVDEKTDLNYKYGHRIILTGNNYQTIYLQYNIGLREESYIDPMNNCKQIFSGHNYTMAIKEDGTLWATGQNDRGQLGLGDTAFRKIFTQVGTDIDWKYVGCGEDHTLAIREDGTLWGTGSNYSGEIGLGDYISRNIFTQVGTDTNWKQVSCGSYHTMAIKEDGTLWATGDNSSGQLGIDDGINRNIFTQVGTDTDWKCVDCGNGYTMAIKENGTLWATGNNHDGQLGLGDKITRNKFTQVGTNTDWKYISCGAGFSIATNNNNNIWGTGNNSHGELGLGYLGDTTTYIQIGTDNDWKQISCGSIHTMGIKNNNTLWATGYNGDGQLGLGHNGSINVFTQVGTDSIWIYISSGGTHSMACKNNKIIWGTGNNYDGQLGINTYGFWADTNIFHQSLNEIIRLYSNVDINKLRLLTLTDNHNIKEISKIHFYYFYDTYIDETASIPINNRKEMLFFLISNNSSINFNNCKMEFKYNSGIPIIRHNIKQIPLKIINNSHCNLTVNPINNTVLYYFIEPVIENNSSISLKYNNEIYNPLIKNKSVVLLNKENYCFVFNPKLINSKIIEEKQ